jgi:sulfatase maturation enzyme AslB (radical SAM superfamily)
MGNLLNESLENIWKNEKFDHFRENYRDTCGTCDLWVIDQVPARAEPTKTKPTSLQTSLLVE